MDRKEKELQKMLHQWQVGVATDDPGFRRRVWRRIDKQRVNAWRDWQKVGLAFAVITALAVAIASIHGARLNLQHSETMANLYALTIDSNALAATMTGEEGPSHD